jgi:hypothetical protein
VNLDQWATLGAGCVVILGGIASYVKWMRPFLSAAKADIISGRDALLGRDAIHDTITGREISPALPGMGIRMDTNETQMSLVVDAVAQIAPALAKIADTQKWQEHADQVLAAHQEQIGGLQKQVTANAREIADLRHGYVERIVSRADSEAAFRAIEAVAQNGTTDIAPKETP